MSLSKLLSLMLLLTLTVSCDRQQEQPEAEEKQAVLRISSEEDPQTLDPRMARSLVNVTYIKMFYEGLINRAQDGSLVPGVAREANISSDGKTYTFHLRECTWSNGDPVTAYDFASSWKSLLSPDFPAPNAYQFYMIKGAKEAKEGAITVDEVAINAIDSQTLVVELSDPTPYFLELTSTHPFCPVHPVWASDTSQPFIGNGAYQLGHWEKRSEVEAVKNPLYWDADQVKLDKIIVMILDPNTALQMYAANEVDWIGSPLSTIPVDALATLKQENRLGVAPGAGTQWFVFNTEKAPFTNQKMRKAFSLAVNRHDIVEHVTQGNQTPATGVVPLSYGLQALPYFEEFSMGAAKKLFQESLEEMQLSAEELPSISLSYVSTERNHKIAQAVQQQWHEAFGIDVQLDHCESKLYFDRIGKREYTLGMGSWYGDFRDPINFLEIFKSKNNSTNSSQWENKQFIDLLNLSARVNDPKNRMNILRRAERILMNDMPVAPIFHASYNYMKNENVSDVYFSELGYLDFKHAYIEEYTH